ncbi:sugar ABC transporter ATP-binding protein [Nocardioides sp. Iso805N]|uniref:sugar ABC transporter ATP-binding protein n=1 Tax=Nocardioides sp. Iso805N TaxID=1283287 RepID=UPI00036FB509|nr:sugar ABC transporter ATP-binding protein [Nocardioides sp. Iso805N]
MTNPAAPRLAVSNISKTFGPTCVLHQAELVVQPGELHALVGQNGSGKSTLVKVLTGYHTPGSGGSVAVDGEHLSLPVEWAAAHRAGIAVVHQDFGLLDHLSVAENIGVGGYERTRFLRRVDWRRQREVAARVLGELQLDIEPTALVGNLSASHRAGVAIARAMRDLVPGGGLVILDESTRSLGRQELSQFHEMLRRIRSTGTSMLLVSHSLDEVLTQTDRVTVLRDGRVVGAGLATAEQSEQSVAKLMLGRDVDDVDTRPAGESHYAPGVTITGLSGPGAASLDIAIGAGEIVGLTGLPGSGFEQLPYLLSGATPASGELTIDSTALSLARASVAACIRAGVVLVPERRDRDGLAMSLSIRDNISLPTLTRHGRPWWAGRGWQATQTDDAIATLGIRPNAPMRLIQELSGGNQQKVLLAKWMSVGPRFMILHEPTQAVDVGARSDILNAVQRAAASGVAVLLVSVEASDLAAACDRVLVYDGPDHLTEIRSTDPDTILDAVYATAAAAS